MAQVLGSGPGAQFRAQFRAQVLGSGLRCSVQGPGARFGAHVLGRAMGSTAEHFRDKVLYEGKNDESAVLLGARKLKLIRAQKFF